MNLFLNSKNIFCLKLLSLLVFSTVVGCAGQPPMITAAMSGSKTEVASLLSSGYPVDAQDEYGRSALYFAAKDNKLNIVKVLLESGADVNLQTASGWTALAIAARYEGDVATLTALLDAGADVHLSTKDGWSPILSAARYRGTDIVKLLLDRGANIEDKNNYNMTALYLAVAAQNEDVAMFLLRRGASLDPVTTEGKSILGFAKEKNMNVDALQRARNEFELYERKARMEDRLLEIEQRDASLPMSIKRDKYLVAFTGALKSEDFLSALFYANLLDRMGIPMDDSFYYFWGEALLELQDPDGAIEKLNFYLSRVGSSGKYYTSALQMILRAEKARDGEVI